jgi:hypothetical protein
MVDNIEYAGLAGELSNLKYNVDIKKINVYQIVLSTVSQKAVFVCSDATKVNQIIQIIEDKIDHKIKIKIGGAPNETNIIFTDKIFNNLEESNIYLSSIKSQIYAIDPNLGLILNYLFVHQLGEVQYTKCNISNTIGSWMKDKKLLDLLKTSSIGVLNINVNNSVTTTTNINTKTKKDKNIKSIEKWIIDNPPIDDIGRGAYYEKYKNSNVEKITIAAFNKLMINSGYELGKNKSGDRIWTKI